MSGHAIGEVWSSFIVQRGRFNGWSQTAVIRLTRFLTKDMKCDTLSCSCCLTTAAHEGEWNARLENKSCMSDRLTIGSER